MTTSSAQSAFNTLVEAQRKAGAQNPFMAAVKSDPGTYNAMRRESETQLAARSRFGSVQPNAVNGADVSRAVIFRVGDPAPNGTATIDRTSLNRLQADLSDAGTVKIFTGDDSVVSNIVGGASNFRIADSQLVADLSFVTSHPQAAKILDAIQRDPASVQFSMTDAEDALIVSIVSGEKLAARGASIMRFAMSNRNDYHAARKAGKI